MTYTDSGFTGRTCHAYQGLGFGNGWANHNFSFTTELRYWFQYQGNENLKFTGDDDVWVFINGTMAVESRGVHNRAVANRHPRCRATARARSPTPTRTSPSATIDFKLTIGSVYEVVVFQAERWCCGSNYMLTLANFIAGKSQCGPTCGDGVLTGTEECDNGADNNDTLYGGCTTQCKFGPFCGDGVIERTRAMRRRPQHHGRLQCQRLRSRLQVAAPLWRRHRTSRRGVRRGPRQQGRASAVAAAARSASSTRPAATLIGQRVWRAMR